ncbi:MAG: hypothetical protein IIZ67_03805 [Bacilli bacterium]|nr:hypothetical protein [Bacilli bacterium]
MKNQEEFEIIKIEILEREKKLAMATTTLYAISSVLSMTSTIVNVYNDKIPLAVIYGIVSIGFGITSNMKKNECKEIDKKIKTLRR